MNTFDKIKSKKTKNKKKKGGGLFAGMNIKSKKKETSNTNSQINNISENPVSIGDNSIPKSEVKEPVNLLENNDLFNNNILNEIDKPDTSEKQTNDQFSIFDGLDDVKIEKKEESPKKKKKPAFGFIKKKKKSIDLSELEVKEEEVKKEIDDSEQQNESNDMSDMVQGDSFKPSKNKTESIIDISVKKSKNDSLDQSHNSVMANDTIDQITKDLETIGFVEKIKRDFRVSKMFGEVEARFNEFIDIMMENINKFDKVVEDEAKAKETMKNLRKEIIKLEEGIEKAIKNERFQEAEDCQGRIDELTERIEQLKGSVKEVSLKDVGLTAKNIAVLRLEKKIKVELNKLLEDKTLIREKKNLYERDELLDFEKRQEDLDEQKNDLETQQDVVKGRLDEVNKEVSVFEERETEKKAKFTKTKNELDQAKESLTEEIEKIRKQLAEKEAELLDIDNKIVENDVFLNEITEDFEKQKKDVSKLKEEIVAEYETYQVKLDNVDKDINKLDEEKNKHKSEIEEIDKLMTDLTEKETKYGEDLEVLKQLFTTFKTNLKSYLESKNKFILQSYDIEDLKEKVETQENYIKINEAEVAAMNEEIDGIEVLMPEQLKKKQEAIKKKNFAMAGQINKEIQRLKQKIETLKESINELIESNQVYIESKPKDEDKLKQLQEAIKQDKAEFFKAYRLTLENKVSILQQIKSEKNEEEIEEMIEKTKAKLESITEAPDNQKNCEEETVEEPVPVVNNEEKEIDYELTKEEEISFILLEIDSKVPKLNEEIEKAVELEDFDLAETLQQELDKLNEKRDLLTKDNPDRLTELPDKLQSLSPTQKQELFNKLLI